MALLSRLSVAAGVLVLGGGLAYLAIVSLTQPDLQKSRQLAANGATATGRVTATFPQNHGTLEYVYDVGGSTFTGAGSVSGANPRPEQLKPGDSIAIVYDRRHPEVSCACSPEVDLASAGIDNIAISAFIGAALAVLVFVGLTILTLPGFRRLNAVLP
jgi:Protein of unknown function (DUF3592)